MAARAPPRGRWWQEWRRWQVAVAASALAFVAGVAGGEWVGWPFLATPLQNFLADRLGRRVQIASNDFAIRFVGGVRLNAPQLEIAAPAWSQSPHMVVAKDVLLEMRYGDLWRAYRGQRLRIHKLQASSLDGYLERRADGVASWQFGNTPPGADQPPIGVPFFGTLQVASGVLRYSDVPLGANVIANLSLANGVSQGASPSVDATANRLTATATGRYRDQPVKIELASSGALPWEADGGTSDRAPVPVALTMDAKIGRAEFTFKGTALDALHLGGLTGRFSLKGPSLAAVGDPLGVTLPTTSAFRTEGRVARQGDTWHVVVDDATVGASRLNGAFTYEAALPVPKLSGRLGGARLLLADLGPAVGMVPKTATEAKPAANSTNKAKDSVTVKASAKNSASSKGSGKAAGKLLPGRLFDLKVLRVMDANVLIDIADVDLNTSLLEPLRPLHTHLQLIDGVLTLRDMDARTADGQLRGDMALDGRTNKALWSANVRWDGVRLERWIHQERKGGVPPFVSGRMNGRANLKGEGRSTAEILGTLKGTARTELQGGAVSHLMVEAGGLDVAQALGVLFKGDDALPVQCAVADLVAQDGLFRPRVMVLDTADSSVWVDGTLSLATEALDLRAVVMPKDFSPLTLRTPLHVGGSFGNPEVSVEKGPLGLKLAGAFLLGLINPLAALIPLVDPGDADAAKRGAAGCQSLMQRGAARRTVAKPGR
jgi:AsmA family protein